MTENRFGYRLSAFFAFIALFLALCFSCNVAYADSGKVNLDSNGGALTGASVQLTDEGTLPELPTPTKEGWTFEGWYTKAVKTEISFENEKDPGTWWRWQSTTEGEKVDKGDKVNADSTLYAKYTPTFISFKLHPAGFRGETGVLSTGREYGVPFSGIVYGWLTSNRENVEYGDYVFDGWYDSLKDGQKIVTVGDVQQGTKQADLTEGWTPLKGQDLWMHWHLKSNPSVTQETYVPQVPSEITGLEIRPRTNIVVDPSGNKTVTIEAYLATDGKFAPDNYRVNWTVSDNENLVDTEIQNNFLHIKGNRNLENPKTTGYVTVTASVQNNAGQTFTDKVTVSVKHTYGNPYNIKAPTCTETGSAQYKCTVCGETDTVTYAAEGHRYVTHEYAATCTEPGHNSRICRECGVHEDEVIPALGHKYITKQIDSCGGTVTLKTCNACGATETTTDQSQVKHEWATTKTVDKEPTCNTEGSESIHCKKCGVTKDVTSIPIDETKHTFNAWDTKVQPTVTNYGLQERFCTTCGTVETRQLDKVIAPDETKDVQPEFVEKDPTDLPDETPTPTPEPEPGPEPEPEPDVTGDPVDVYRLYNKYTGEHLLTADKNEKDVLSSHGWNDEGTAFVMNTKVGIPVYRLYNTYSGEHLYTVSKNEHDALVSLKWNSEGIVFYSAEKGNPVYRLYNPWAPAIAQHLLTTSDSEYTTLKGIGWHDEDVAFYTY